MHGDSLPWPFKTDWKPHATNRYRSSIRILACTFYIPCPPVTTNTPQVKKYRASFFYSSCTIDPLVIRKPLVHPIPFIPQRHWPGNTRHIPLMKAPACCWRHEQHADTRFFYFFGPTCWEMQKNKNIQQKHSFLELLPLYLKQCIRMIVVLRRSNLAK